MRATCKHTYNFHTMIARYINPFVQLPSNFHEKRAIYTQHFHEMKGGNIQTHNFHEMRFMYFYFYCLNLYRLLLLLLSSCVSDVAQKNVIEKPGKWAQKRKPSESLSNKQTKFEHCCIFTCQVEGDSDMQRSQTNDHHHFHDRKKQNVQN